MQKIVIKSAFHLFVKMSLTGDYLATPYSCSLLRLMLLSQSAEMSRNVNFLEERGEKKNT